MIEKTMPPHHASEPLTGGQAGARMAAPAGTATAFDVGSAPLTEDQKAGLACMRCLADLRNSHEAVAQTGAAQLFACPGDCSRSLTGDPGGLGHAPMPLAIRVGRNDGWAW